MRSLHRTLKEMANLFSDAIALCEASAARSKSLPRIKEANHNDIFLRGLDQYMEAIQALVGQIA